MAAQPLVVDFKKIDKGDLPSVGGKGANLGEMTKAGFPVPSGFAVTVAAYDLFLAENNLAREINDILKKKDRHQPDELNQAAQAIQRKILGGQIPETVAKEVIADYKKMSGHFRQTLVAVRSSATAEDLPEASFAGQQATFLNVKGEANLLESVRKCWASLFTGRAIFYREENKIPHEKVKISVLVQEMITADVSGVLFTIDPVTNEKDRVVIEAVWGLGEMIVQGSVVPDRYVVQKETFSILSKEISDQAIQLVKVGSENKEVEVPKTKREIQKIKDEDIIKLAKIGDQLQKHYYFPQDVEWAKEERGEIYIVQTRPVTTMKAVKRTTEIKTETKTEGKAKAKEGEVKEDYRAAASAILTGTAASPGIGTGQVKITKSPKEINKIGPGDILVAPMTSPDYVPAMKKASAIITDQGGLTSHAAIVSRELGIPCVVGTKEATIKLKENNVVTVDGGKGLVYLGSKIKIEKTEVKKKKKYRAKLKTATRVYVNLGEPERVKEIAKKNADGVGLLRAEFMIANIGIHPKEAIKRKKQNLFTQKLTQGLKKFCQAFDPRPVVYRATDFKTNEYRSLEGGKAWEPEEPNPMLGFRGAYRYLAHPEVFNLELQAIKKTREEYKNLWLMIPFVRTPQELVRIRRQVAAEGLFESPSFKFWMMVELPVNVIRLADFLRIGIDGVSIGSNDLTMLILGTDRDNAEVAQVFDEQNPAVLWALRRTIKTCHRHKVTSSICGQAPSVYNELVTKLVKYGITSISVNPDAVERVREVVYDAEKELVRK